MVAVDQEAAMWVLNGSVTNVAFANFFHVLITELQPRGSYQQRLPTKGILSSEPILISSRLRHAAITLRTKN